MFTQGICGDGAAILNDGTMMSIEEIVDRLNSSVEPVASCEWGQYCFDDTDMSLWHSACGEAFAITDGDPKENGMKYCCYCGKPLTVQHYFEEDEETGEMIRP